MYEGKNLLPNNAVLYNQYLKDRSDVLEQPFSMEIIRKIDKSEVIGPRIIQSPLLGEISGSELSGGVKGLLVMKFVPKLHNHYFRGEGFGANCVHYILELAETIDIRLSLAHLMEFPDNGFRMYVENNGHTVVSYNEYAADYAKYCARIK